MVELGGVAVATGDLIVADADGIAVIPDALTEAVLADVAGLERREAELVPLLEGGMTTLDALGLA